MQAAFLVDSKDATGPWPLALAVLFACNDVMTASEQNASVDAAPPPASPATSGPAWVFDEAQVRSYELELDPERWRELQATALDEQYEPATLHVDGAPVGQVGLRFKGSNGTLGRCARAGKLVCRKLSMKVRFDEYDPALRFHGLKRLNFNSMLSDASLLHERLAYRLFREMGVVAPRAVHARLSVNGESLGVFSLVEDIDGRFTDHHLPGGNGNLYKEYWPSWNDPEGMNQRLETNEEAPDHEAMIAFRSDLAGAAPEDLPRVVERYMDVDNLLAYIAVDASIANWDGMTAFYCRGGRHCRNHNYFIYQHGGAARFTLIPWDLDNTFKLYNSFDLVPGPLEIPDDCSLRYPSVGGLMALAPACDPLLQGLARTPSSRYQAQLTRLLDGPLDIDRLEAWLDERVAQLTPFVLEDATGPGLLDFRTHVEALRRDLRLIAMRASAVRDGESSERWRLDADGLNDFEAVTPLGVEFGALGISAPDSGFDVALGQGEALAGQASLELGFEFRDATDPWGHWLRFTMPFAAGRADLTQKSALRLLLQSDAPRTIWIGILSSNYTQIPTATSATLGWAVTVDTTPRALELRLADAAFPAWSEGLTDDPSAVFSFAAALQIDPQVQGRGADGYLGPDVVDRGRIRVDQIEFLP
jgi:spore coat protein H